MIKIIPFQNNIFDNTELNKQNLTSHTFVTSKELVNRLMNVKLPIEKRKALIRIFIFLNFVDNNVKDDNTIIINKFKLEEYFTRNKYKDYMKLLSKHNVIHKVMQNGIYNSFYFKKINPKNNKIEYYSNGIFYTNFNQVPQPVSTKYKLHNNYVNPKELAIVILEEKKKIVPKFNCEIQNLDDRYKSTIKYMNLNIVQAINSEVVHWRENKLSSNALRIRISRVLGTLRDRFIKKGNKVDRIYHSFTNVSRVARKHFNKRFYNLDIVNCQPLMLVAYLKQNSMNIDLLYQENCEAGLFYESFYGLCNFESEDDKRSKIKKSIYQNIFFGFNKKSRYNKNFHELYPQTWDSLFVISETNTSLASRLQNMEASLFNNLVPKYSKHFFTLFDAIYFSNKMDTTQLTKEIEIFFSNLSIKVQIK